MFDINLFLTKCRNHFALTTVLGVDKNVDNEPNEQWDGFYKYIFIQINSHPNKKLFHLPHEPEK